MRPLGNASRLYGGRYPLWRDLWKAALNAFDINFDCRLSTGHKQRKRQKLHSC
jgi:hypothetical protein